MDDANIIFLQKEEEVDRQCKQFSVIRPYLPNSQRHPEEGAYEKVNDTTWKQHMNELGQIEDDFHLRKVFLKFQTLSLCALT